MKLSHDPDLASRDHVVARFRIFAGAFLVYLGYAIGDLGDESTATRVWACVLIAMFCAAYLIGVPRGMIGGPLSWRLGSPLAMLAVTAVYLVGVGRGGLVFMPYCSVAIMFALPRRFSVPVVVTLATAVVLLPEHVGSWDLHGLQWGTGVPMLIAAGVMVLVQNQARGAHQLMRSQQELEQLAADQERLRIARDLHDILGHALTTVTVKAELAARLVERDPAKAAAEMNEVAALARQGLADVRATVEGYREVTLAIELATAREVLVAAGMTPELPASTEEVSGELRELFGWVVREGVTNAVRHSRAQTVRIAVEQRAVEIVDDGCGGPCGNGSGLMGLRERVTGMGGRLLSGPVDGGGFRLRAEVA